MENLDDFIDHNVPTKIIIEYYIVFTPEIIRLMTPVALLLSALYVVSKLSGHNELTAIKSSGISFYRLMLPFLITSFLLSLFSIYFGGYVVPSANKHKVYIAINYLKKGVEPTSGKILFQDSKYRIVLIHYYDVINHRAHRVSFNK